MRGATVFVLLKLWLPKSVSLPAMDVEVPPELEAERQLDVQRKTAALAIQQRARKNRTAQQLLANTKPLPGVLEAAFEAFDEDSSGDICVSELQNALNHLGMESDSVQAAAVMRKYDSNPDGKLDLGEFTQLVSDLRAYQAGSGAFAAGSAGPKVAKAEMQPAEAAFPADEAGASPQRADEPTGGASQLGLDKEPDAAPPPGASAATEQALAEASRALAEARAESELYRVGWQSLCALPGLSALPGLPGALASLPARLRAESRLLVPLGHQRPHRPRRADLRPLGGRGRRDGGAADAALGRHRQEDERRVHGGPARRLARRGGDRERGARGGRRGGGDGGSPQARVRGGRATVPQV